MRLWSARPVRVFDLEPFNRGDYFAAAAPEVLASTISLTPGTVSANLRMDGKSLLIHALNVDDEEALIEQIRERYERPLKEIYEC